MNGKFNQAFEYHQKGQLTLARDLYVQIVNAEPQNHEVWDLLGILYTQVGQYDTALECLQKAIDLKPLPFYIENLAKMYFHKNDFENAISCKKSCNFTVEVNFLLEREKNKKDGRLWNFHVHFSHSRYCTHVLSLQSE